MTGDSGELAHRGGCWQETARGSKVPQLRVLRLMPNDEMRDDKVDGFIPSSSAAPPGPETFPFVRLRAFMMVSRSWRFNSFRVRTPPVTAGLASCPGLSGGGEAGTSKVSGPSRHKMTARSTKF